MKNSIKTGFSFGLTSGIITTLGLMVGLYSGTQSKLVVIGGILTIAVADAFSDALGIHVSQESQDRYSKKEVWAATITTFFSKAVFAMTFIIPILFMGLGKAVLVGAIWGLLVLSLFSFTIAKRQDESPAKVIAEHLVIGLLVILITYVLGDLITSIFSI
ncbi:MAG: VIT1/CCC1 transporter family protein [Patescibacteria group bacterium]|nr:hypothetical protein [Patescibacteria group bacterium]